MGLLDRVAALRAEPRRGESRYSMEQYFSDASDVFNNWAGSGMYPLGLGGFAQTWRTGRVEEISDTLPSYAAALRGCPPAFAAQMVRALVLSGARFVFRNPPWSKTPRRRFGTSMLSLLERPWRNALFTVYALSARPELEKSEVAIPLARRPAARHIVLIVDKSVSGDFIDLNVPRGTTPYLASGPAGLVNFGLATAASNCSNSSNLVLRLGVNPEQLGAEGYSPLANPSVWKYARQAGFETNYVEAYPLTAEQQNFMNPSEMGLVDPVLTVPADIPVAARDAEVAKLLPGVLSRRAPQFVYVNTAPPGPGGPRPRTRP